MVPGDAARWVTLPSALLSRSSESVVAISNPPCRRAWPPSVRPPPGAANESSRCRDSRPSTSPRWVWATSTPRPGPEARRSDWLRGARSACHRSGGAPRSVPPGGSWRQRSCPPITAPLPRSSPAAAKTSAHRRLPRSTAYTFRSMLPPYRVLSWTSTGSVNRRPASCRPDRGRRVSRRRWSDRNRRRPEVHATPR